MKSSGNTMSKIFVTYVLLYKNYVSKWLSRNLRVLRFL